MLTKCMFPIIFSTLVSVHPHNLLPRFPLKIGVKTVAIDAWMELFFTGVGKMG